VSTSSSRDASAVERQALDHLWIQSQGVDWDELTDGEGLKVFARGNGTTLVDLHGREYLDGLAGLFVVAVGHGRAEIAAAMAEQAGTVAYVAASRFSTPSVAELAETIAELAPGDLDRTHFCSGGSEAVETAVKIARQAQTMRGFAKRYKVIARRGSYHGSTAGAMSLTSTSNEGYFGPLMAGTSFVPSPNRYRNDLGLEGEAGDIMCAKLVEQEIQTHGPETVAAVIGEPISGSNGVHVPSPVYWQMIREICDRYGIFLIFDEVVTGFGRTGTLFGAEQFGVVPDMMTIAKGLSSGYAPIGGVVVRSSVFDDFKQPGASLSHLLTFGGHPVAAAAANKNVEILLEEDLAAESAAKGEYLLSLLDELRTHSSVGDVRGLGLLCGVELVKHKATKASWGGPRSAFVKAVQRGMERRGLLTRAWDTLFLSPPLVVTRDELERMVTIIDESLSDAEREFASDIG
jgi:adenosylmethionine-8-amino-7-oxononanoate aminotransferase